MPGVQRVALAAHCPQNSNHDPSGGLQCDDSTAWALSHIPQCRVRIGQKVIHRLFINAFGLGTAHATQSAKGARTEWPLGPRSADLCPPKACPARQRAQSPAGHPRFRSTAFGTSKLGGGIDRRPPPGGRRDSAAGFKSRPCRDISFPDSPRGHGGNPPARCRIV